MVKKVVRVVAEVAAEVAAMAVATVEAVRQAIRNPDKCNSGVGGSANLLGAFRWLEPLQEALIAQADGSYQR